MTELNGRRGALRPVSRPRLYEQLVERLLEYVSEEGMTAGRRLPTERAQAERLGVSRASVPQAIVALGVKITSLAAQRRTDQDLVAIEAALAKMVAQVSSGEHGYDGDLTFHEAVTAAAHNPILSVLMGLLAGSIEETRRESLAQVGRPSESLASHRSIAEAIRDGDSAGAAEAALRHTTLVGDVAPLTWERDDSA